MSTEKSMDELVKLAAAGDDAAVTELYERTSNHAYYLALQLVKDEDEAQDILEDAYIKALMNIGSLQDPSKFQSWLNSIVVNASKDYLKKKKPVLFSQLSSSDEGDEAMDFVDESEQFSPDATVDYNETKRLVKEMIDNLPEEQRIAIILHYMEDYSVKDIAQVMGCSEGTVKSRLNYGRKRIEKDVLDLEKKGTKLYCAPLVPFLFWMFHTPAPASVISTAASASMAAGAATDSTVGATVTAGTAAGSTVGATVTTGTAAGSTVGATVSTETAASTVGASVAADVAETTASTVGASVTTGTAAGSTVGATVTTGTAAGAATATATGLSLAAKIGIVAAVICIGGGAAVGVTMMNRNSTRDEVISTEITSAYEENMESLTDEPQNWQEAYDLAEEAMSEEDYDSAIDAYTKAISFDSNEPKAYLGRGNAIILSGETEGNLSLSLEDYEKALELDDTLADASLGIADVYIRMEEYDEALEYLKDALGKTNGNEKIAEKIAEIESGNITDMSGNIRKEISYDDQGNILWYHEYTYNEKGQMATAASYDSIGNQTGFVELTYNDDGQKLIDYWWAQTKDEFGIVEEEYISIVENQYDEKGNRIGETWYERDGSICEYLKNEYDAAGNPVRQYSYYPDGTINYVAAVDFDANGKKVKDTRYDASGEVYAWYEYDRDENGNILNERYYSNGALKKMTEYYYDSNGNSTGYTEYDGAGNVIQIVGKDHE